MKNNKAEQPAQQQGCEFCSHPLYAGTKCKNCGREQPAQQEEPTKAMIDAGERIDWSDSDVRGNIVNMWQAMSAAAPQPAQQDSTCNKKLREQGKTYPLTCKKCGLGPCIADRVQPAPVPEAHKQQEPVAWPVGSAELHIGLLNMGKAMAKERSREIGDAWNQLADLLALLAKSRESPPASKPWVGLTEEEWEELADKYGVVLWRPLKSDVEAKLREKNAQPSKPLTDEQIDRLYASCKYGSVLELARAIEAAHGIKENA